MSIFEETFYVKDMPEQEGGDFSPIPAGEYTVEIKSAEIKQTKAGNGSYIDARMDVTEGKHAKRVLFANINIKNPSEVAEKIGRAQLGEIMRANNIAALQATDQLIGCTMIVRVVISEYKGEAKNEVKGYKAAGTRAAMPKASAPASNEPAVVGKAPPWANKKK